MIVIGHASSAIEGSVGIVIRDLVRGGPVLGITGTEGASEFRDDGVGSDYIGADAVVIIDDQRVSRK